MQLNEESQLLERLKTGDEAAFMELVNQLHASMVRMAAIYVGETAAEEVAQETWIGVLRGLDRFEGRSSLKTWIFSILINRARTQSHREGRGARGSIIEISLDEPTISPDHFIPEDVPNVGNHWATRPQGWENIPESRLLSEEIRSVVLAAIERLPPSQREVITLRDVESWTSDEVCNVLEISDTNQRVLLHRARAAVRRILASYLEETGETVP